VTCWAAVATEMTSPRACGRPGGHVDLGVHPPQHFDVHSWEGAATETLQEAGPDHREFTIRSPRRALLVLLTMLGLVIAGYVLWSHERPPPRVTGQGGPGDGSTPEHPSLLGAGAGASRPADQADAHSPSGPPDADTAPSEGSTASANPAITLRGLVTDEADAAIAGATVFVLRKGNPGYRSARSKPAKRPITKTDAKGRWSVHAEDLDGSWIGALADGYEAAYVDGASRPRKVVHLRLKRCREFTFVVEGVNGPPPDGARVWGISLGETYELPGPDSARRFYVAAKVEPSLGTVSLHAPLQGTVVFRASHWGSFAEPEHVVLTAHRPRVTFRLLSSCILHLRVSDAATGEPLGQGFGFSVRRAGKAVHGGRTNVNLTGGEFRVADSLRPGRHTVIISSKGYLDSKHEGVVFPEPGGGVTVEAALKRDPSLGRLRVRVPGLAALPPLRHPHGGVPEPAPAFFLMRRVAPSAGDWGQAYGDHEWDGQREDATTYSFSHLPPGEVDVFVGNIESNRVAILRSVAIPRGSTNTVTADLAKGAMIDLGTLLEDGSEYRFVALRSEQHGSLPMYTRSTGLMSVYDRDDAIDMKKELGPYPIGPASMDVLTKGKIKKRWLTIRAP
jgi:hypothetical protein